MSIFNSVEEELWRIFTFYSIHTDPTLPYFWRPANFVKFSKDCQITSKKLTPAAVELEIAHLARTKSIGSDYNGSMTIEFSDFMNLLDALSIKVYPRDPPDIAVKRLILENVLLLANRRVPSNDCFDLSDVEANKVVNETYNKCLLNIFKYYLDIAEKRRNQAVTVEKIRTNKELNGLPAQRNLALSKLKETAKSQKDYISYKEYIQFCHDFNLKSTSLMTAIQVGEIFLNIVPFSADQKNNECGMNFEMFCQAIVYMSAVGYRDCPAEITLQSKVKALLLYMWKAVNDNDKTMRMINSTRINAITSSAGSMNLYGSGLFSDQFLAAWMKDGFPDYTAVAAKASTEAGAEMMKKLVGDTTDLSGEKSHAGTTSTAEEKSSGGTSLAKKSIRNPSSALDLHKVVLDYNTSSTIPTTHTIKSLTGSDAPVTLQGSHLSQLLRAKPELTEFLHLEIMNMKMSDMQMINI